MIHCKELDTNFETKELLFKALLKNKDKIIAVKKANILKSIEKDNNLGIKANSLIFKEISQATNKELSFDEDYYYIAVNSANILDSHEDVHMYNCWNKTVKEMQGKVYLVDSHNIDLNSIIVYKEDIEILTAIVPFSMIGKDYEGETEVLIYKFPKNKVINPVAKNMLDEKKIIYASVRMQYTDISLAVNDDDPAFSKQYQVWLDNIDKIVNKSDYNDFYNTIYYFWVVKQAKNVIESSLVLFPSNNSTGRLVEQKDANPQPSTGKIETGKPSLSKQDITDILYTIETNFNN